MHARALALPAFLALAPVLVPAARAESSGRELVAGLEADLSYIQAQARKIGGRVPAALSAKGERQRVKDRGARPAVWGIDVSRYQGSIRWDLVREAGLSFVYMKATEGTRIVDPTFLENWQGASRIGLVKGAYHFYDLCAPAAPQAAEFIKVVPRTPGALPPAIDLEPTRRCAKLPSKRVFLKELRLFAGRLRARYGKTPVLYMGHDLYDRYLKGAAHPYPIWISDYRGRPALSDRRPWTFWQCSCEAKIRGITGPVDLDLFAGSAAQFGFLGRPVKSLPESRSQRGAGPRRTSRSRAP